MALATDLTGKRFGRLVVLKRDGTEKSGAARWLCKCDCGNTTTVRGHRLRNGTTQSCGCYAREVSAIMHGEPHGCSNDRLYAVWRTMKARCYNQNNDRYTSYGARGIKVCDEWKNSFLAFREWALASGYDYDAPYVSCTLDRIDINGNYEPSNCRWADLAAQAKNKRPCPRHTKGYQVVYRGRRYVSLSDLADTYNFNPKRLYRRIHRMSLDEAMSEILGDDEHCLVGR